MRAFALTLALASCGAPVVQPLRVHGRDVEEWCLLETPFAAELHGVSVYDWPWAPHGRWVVRHRPPVEGSEHGGAEQWHLCEHREGRTTCHRLRDRPPAIPQA